jgi:hypothetical protein
MVVAHTSAAALAMASALEAVPFAFFVGPTAPILWATSGLAAYLLGMTVLVGLLEFRIRHRLRENGQRIEPFKLWTLLPVMCAVPLTQFAQLVATLQATFVKRVAWRGLILEVNGPNDICVVDDERPNGPSEESVATAA